ncbi:hypothetical protein GQX74_006303 [Glossina fuscipes]|nr:hypothetical protein GQX74_006303 [Glossina fuscipes]
MMREVGLLSVARGSKEEEKTQTFLGEVKCNEDGDGIEQSEETVLQTLNGCRNDPRLAVITGKVNVLQSSLSSTMWHTGPSPNKLTPAIGLSTASSIEFSDSCGKGNALINTKLGEHDCAPSQSPADKFINGAVIASLTDSVFVAANDAVTAAELLVADRLITKK